VSGNSREPWPPPRMMASTSVFTAMAPQLTTKRGCKGNALGNRYNRCPVPQRQRYKLFGLRGGSVVLVEDVCVDAARGVRERGGRADRGIPVVGAVRTGSRR